MLRYLIAVAAIAVVAVSCEHNTYTDQELQELRDTWYDEGYQAGLLDKLEDYYDGYDTGFSLGYQPGYWDGKREGKQDAYAEMQELVDRDQFVFMGRWFGDERVNQGCYELFGDWCDS